MNTVLYTMLGHDITPDTKKITLMLPADLVQLAQKGRKESLTEIIREALTESVHRRAGEELLKLRGKVRFGLSHDDIKAMRE